MHSIWTIESWRSGSSSNFKKFSVNKDSWLKTDQEDQIKKKNSISIQENASVYKPKLKFELTPFQKKISRQALEAVLSHKDCFIYAAAGSGKTEIVLESISTYLKMGNQSVLRFQEDRWF